MKLYLKTFGCQMNFRDSEWITGKLLALGWQEANAVQEADLIIVNTCSVRDHAEHRAISYLGTLQELKKKRNIKIVLSGCVAESYGSELLRKYPYLDAVFGPSQENELIERINDLFKNNYRIDATGRQVNIKGFNEGSDFRKNNSSALVTIMEGCNNFCSYCIVPYVRGRERSRPMPEIVDEVKFLKDRGCKEVMLLGQNVNSYQGIGYRVQGIGNRVQGAGNDFVRLLEEVDKTGIERVRFMTSHPKDASTDLFKAIRDLKSVCEHIHLPLQSGSDRILGLMNRGYTQAQFLKLVDAYRKELPKGSITTDAIVGFPSESEIDFNETVNTFKKIEFDSAFVFKYSPRLKTKANSLIDHVKREEKERRNIKLLCLQKEIATKKREGFIGKVLSVLFQGPGSDICAKGRSRENFMVHAQASGLDGLIKDVKIKAVRVNSLIGEIVQSEK